MKPTINLKIYDEQDGVIAEFETSRIRWGFLEDVVEINENMKNKSEVEQFKMMGEMIQKLFPTLTNELLRQADYLDVQNCFNQIKNIANRIEGTGSKNV